MNGALQMELRLWTLKRLAWVFQWAQSLKAENFLQLESERDVVTEASRGGEAEGKEVGDPRI